MEVKKLKDFYQGKTVLVTGHTGFKGSWLTHVLLSFGAKVVGVSLPPKTERDIFVRTDLVSKVSHHEFDIHDGMRLAELVKSEKPDIVFHLAAQPLVRRSYDEPLLTISTNVVGTANTLEAIRLAGTVKAAIIITTDKVYENREWLYGYRENDALGGYDPYSGSKAAADIVTEAYRRSFFHPEKYGDTHGTLIGIARAGNVIGGGDWSENRLVPDIMRAVFLSDGVVTLRNPQAVRPWEHVLEPVSGYLLLGMKLGEGEKAVSGAWNFGPGHISWVSVGELTDKMLKQLGKGKLVDAGDKSIKHEAQELVLDTTKANRMLGWSSRWSFDKTLAETVRWYATADIDSANASAVTKEQIADYFNFSN